MLGKALALAAVVLCFAPTLGAAAGLLPSLAPPPLWTRDLGAGEATGAAIDALGNVFVAGTQAGTITVWRLDALGAVVWQAPLARGLAGGIAARPDLGGVVVVGSSVGQGTDAYVAALDPDGALLWERTIATPADDAARGVVATTDAIYIAGSTGKDLLLARIDPDGLHRWTRALDFGREEVLQDALALRDGSPVGVGWSYDGVRNLALLVHLDALGDLDPATGGWVRFVAAPDGGHLRGYAGEGTPAGFVIAGEEARGLWKAPYAASFTALGALQWQSTLGRETGASARSLALDAVGGTLLAGPGGAGRPGLVARLGPTGDVAWSGAFEGPGSAAAAVAAHPAGLVVVAGAAAGEALATAYADAPLRVR
ncbi:MAG TPA: hypothetical protein VGR28_11710 [Candidatus Thermoplasmatota archaeon]|nr:hypothetical protein [Candidatus Thermoplasmatota archaeon]